MITKVTNTMVDIEGEALRGVTWVRVQDDRPMDASGNSLHLRQALTQTQTQNDPAGLARRFTPKFNLV